MSGAAAIRAEALGKRYRIGAPAPTARTRRGALLRAAGAPFRYLAASLRGPSEAETLWALRDVSFEIRRGEVVGIIGRNGAGKSTLLRILSRITEPTEGRADIYGRVGSLLEVGTGFHPELTGRENIYLNGAILGMRKAEIARKFDEIVAFSEVEKFIDTPVKRYSSGMYVRLAFAVAAHLDTEILLVDEVLAVGDAAFRQKCLGKMGGVAREGRTVLFVSHNMPSVQSLCERALVIESGNCIYDGSPAEAIGCYESRVLAQARRVAAGHVLYEHPGRAPEPEMYVSKIEMLDAGGMPMSRVCTHDRVCFRIHYRSRRRIADASVELRFSSSRAGTILLLSTKPDAGVEMQIEQGEHQCECEIAKLPLCAGQYTLGAALAIPGYKYLWRDDNLALLRVQPRDVYGSGWPPVSPRSGIAVEHEWRVCHEDPG